MVRIASRRVLFILASVLAVVIAGLTLAPPANALAMTDDYGVTLDDGSTSWNVIDNDGDPNTSGFDYVDITSGPDTGCLWICSYSGPTIYVDTTSAPSTPSGVLDIGYDLIDGDTGLPIGSAVLHVAVVPDHLDVTSGNGQITVSWPGMPASIGGLHISYDTNDVSDHTTGTAVTTTGNGSRTITGLTNGTTYYTYVTPYFHGVDLEAGCGYSCGLTGSTSPRASNHPPVAVDDSVSLVDTTTKFFYPTDNDTDADFDQLSITGHTAVAHGTLNCDSSSCDYTPTGAPQNDSFTYTVSDGYGGTDTGTVNFVVRNAHATNDSGATFVDESTDINVLANDTGTIASDSVDLGSVPSGVDAYVDFDTNHVIVTGVTQGSYSIPYSIYDNDFDQLSSATIAVTVGAKRALVANDDQSGTDLDVPVDVGVAQNDYIKAAGFPLNTANTKITVAPAHGTATLSFVPDDYYDTDTDIDTLRNLPVIHYVPATDFLGTDTMTYQLQDAQGHVDTGVLTIDVVTPQAYFLDVTPGIASADLDFAYSSSPAVDDVMACYTVGTDRIVPPPTPTDRTSCAHEIALPAGTPRTFHWTGLTNDVVYNVSFWVHSHNGTGPGVWSDETDTTFRPGVEQVRNATGDGGASNFQVSWTNPFAPQDSTGTTIRYTSGATPAPTTPTEGSGFSVGSGVTSFSTPVGTTLAAGTYHVAIFSTNTGTYGDPVTLDLKVASGNHSPTVTTDSLTLDENTAADVSPLANDTDADADPLDIRSYTQPPHGFVYCSGDSAFSDPWVCTYEPDTNYVGADSFTYVAWDHRFGESTGTVNITVNQVNTAPEVNDDSFTASTAKATPVDLTQDAFDLEGNTLTYTIVTPPAHGSLTCPTPNTGLCSYTSAAAFTGADSFVWKATDNGTNPANLSSTNATMDITVVTNQPPTVEDQDVSANSGVAKIFSIATGSSDPDGDTLTFTKTSEPQKGSVTCTTAGSCTYTAIASASGQDSFNFQAADGHGGTAIGSVLIDITHVNRAPVANDTSASTDNGTPVVTNVNSLSTDPDGDSMTFSKVSGPTGTNAGTVTCSGTSCTYTPASTFVGTTTYTYQASDGHLTDNGVVTITVSQVNRPPVVGNETVNARPAQATAVNVAVNDSDPDGDSLSYAVQNQPVHGSASCSAVGSCSYTSIADYSGQDSFTYTVSDGHAHTVVGTVTLNVGANHPPVAGPDTLTTTSGHAGTVNVAANDTDADSDPLTFAKATDGSHGSVTCTGGGSCTYTPASGYTGTDSFTYTVSDTFGGTATGTVSVTVKPILFVFTAPPKVTGKAVVGKVLTAKKGTFTPATAKVTYKWLRNGKAIKHATKSKYKLTTKDRGKKIAVKITYKYPGATTVVKTVKVKKRIV